MPLDTGHLLQKNENKIAIMIGYNFKPRIIIFDQNNTSNWVMNLYSLYLTEIKKE